MRPLGGNLEGLPNSRGIVGVDPHDEWGICDIHVERGHHLVVIIVSCVGDVEPRRSVMNRGVIETAIPCVRGKLDGAQQSEAHQVACSNLAFPSTLSRQYV